MTPYREWFNKYEKYDGGEVLLGDDRQVKIIFLGRVKVLMHDCKVRSLPGVMYIPSLAKNLIFISKMFDADVDFSCNKTSCKIVHGSIVLTWGVQVGTLYRLLESTMTDKCNNSFISKIEVDETSVDKSTLWH